MKAMVCEMCNSHDLVKQDGFFVCQNCGTKYSVEEAKKLMIEGTVDVSGSSVKIDSSDRIAKLYQIARRENEKLDGDALKYYEELAIECPNDWEAYFYKEYYKTTKMNLGEATDALLLWIERIEETFKLLKNNEPEEKHKDIAEEINDKITNLAFLWRMSAESNFKPVNGTTPYVSLTSRAFSLVKATGDYLIELFGFTEMAVDDYKRIVTVASNCWYGFCFNSFTNEVIGEIRKYDSSYVPPMLQSAPKANNGCYVATAVYGSYDCPEVWTLRRYRDYELAETWYGRAFIRTYYTVSPTIVKLFGNSDWFKKMWKGKLDKMVINLQGRGYESTPYNDKIWK